MNIKLIRKIHRKIDNIAKGGPENIFLYKKLIKDILDSNEYDILYEVLLRHYKIDISEYKNFEDIKNKTFDRIRLLTPSNYEENVKRLQLRLGFYNIGLDVYSNENIKMGMIFQKGDVNFISTKLGTFEMVGTDEFDVYKKSVEKIILDYEN